MRYVDTHAHLSDEQFSSDVAEVIKAAKEEGVERILVPDVGVEGRDTMIALCDQYSDFLTPMVGVHPTTINDINDWRVEVDAVESLLLDAPKKRYCAIGEIGLDYYWSRDSIAAQRDTFLAQCELALRFDLPINIHTRDAWSDMCDLLESFKGRGLRGVMHAFCDGIESYERISKCGEFLFSIGGVVTFKRSQVASIVPHIPLEKLLLETDSPYLTPTPHRGKRNEPQYISHICAKIAELKGTTPEAVAETTTANAIAIFNL